MRTLLYLICCLLPLQSMAKDIPVARNAMVVSEQKLASQIGIDVLRAGGNAIDAAVAVGYALAVVNPCCGNIGGGGFMTIHLANGKNIFLNFREKAPLAAQKNMFLDKDGRLKDNQTLQGYLAVGVPGTVLGLETARKRYGTLSRQTLMQPAIKLAREGYTVTSFDAKWFKVFAQQFREQKNVAAIFLKDGNPYPAGAKLVQRDLANTLELIANDGPDAFYKGKIAKTIVTASKEQGGILTLSDFANYHVEEMAPIYCSYRGYTIISAPPPSSGGITLCEMLNILENFPLEDRNATTIHYIVEAMNASFIDRNTKLGDPQFVKNPISQLLSKQYAKEISRNIKKFHVKKNENAAITAHELTQTTHYSIVDAKGNAVSVTYTLNGFFGAGVIASNTGFFLNNEMDDFATQPNKANAFGLIQSDANAIAPGKRPLSSMTPTLVMKDGKIFMVLGSPGGPRIITSVLLTLLNVINEGMNIEAAVNQPRFHYQAQPDILMIEPNALSLPIQKKLIYLGHLIKTERQWGAVEAILIDPNTHLLYGGSDHRRPDGAAMGY